MLPSAKPASIPPKYWNESMQPEAKPAILRAPISMAAAVPMIECVELAVNAIRMKNTIAAVGP